MEDVAAGFVLDPVATPRGVCEMSPPRTRDGKLVVVLNENASLIFNDVERSTKQRNGKERVERTNECLIGMIFLVSFYTHFSSIYL
jgi:hypothetical protein